MVAQSGSGYAGDITAREAWDLLAGNPDAVLVDVRTRPEWTFVGAPFLQAVAKEPLFVEWQVYPDMSVRPDFVAAVEALLAQRGLGRSAPVLLLCRSGARSRSAAVALTASGFTSAFNIAGGFEGPQDGEGHRGTVDGWKAADLPWAQG
ncbi:rhodanese-like domain-containing protein [Segnochrobactrum spirostomi]|uniref:Rhodanese-like domain-containing protein n=1 Tax=Segnochrobactrum spirostomi TaxID=2608987 RepID=A0A6A7Y1V1_9HYPH|nr:rhodanese-like domain-containing protein [Segnochrobactrum spirostomi]MQT13004.1 rhodanese-like domain-containing protein [Segnochrobactrum spirostomi]